MSSISIPLVGHLTRMCPFLDDGWAPTEKAVSASTRAAQRVTAPRAAVQPASRPTKGVGWRPVVRGGFPAMMISSGEWISPRQRAVHDDPLNRLDS